MKTITKATCVAILVLSSSLTFAFWLWPRLTPQQVVSVTGESHHAMGVSYGRQCKRQIQGVFALLDTIFPVFEFLGDKEGAQYVAEFSPWVPPDLVDEMYGVAEGAGVTYEEIFILNAMAEIMMSTSQGGHACSQFIKVNNTAPELGGGVLGRTLDFLPNVLLQDFQVILQIDFGGTKMIGHTIAGWVGFMTGMNDRGLVASASVITTDEIGPCLPWGLAIRWALQHNTTVEEAREFLLSVKHGYGWNFMLLDRFGQAACLEITHDHNHTRWVADESSEGYLTATNIFHSDVMFPHGPDQLTSRSRKYTMDRVLAENPTFGLNDSIRLLRNSYDSVVNATNPGIHTVNRRWVRKSLVPTGTLGSFIGLPNLNYTLVCLGYSDTGLWYAVTFEEVIGPIA